MSRMPNNTWNTAVVIADEQEESDPRAELEKLKVSALDFGFVANSSRESTKLRLAS